MRGSKYLEVLSDGCAKCRVAKEVIIFNDTLSLEKIIYPQ